MPPLADEDFPEEATDSHPPFFAAPLAWPDAAWRQVSLSQLVRFFTNPCRYLLRERQGIRLEETEAELQDDEPFQLDWPGWRSMSDRLLPLMLSSGDPYRLDRLAAAGHEFPDGQPGELLRRRELTRLQEFAAVVREATIDIQPAPLAFALDFDLGGEAWQLAGSLTGLSAQGLVRYRCDNTRPADYLATWLSHLALCALQPDHISPQSRCLSLDGAFRLRPVTKPQTLLIELLECYRQGLCQPLHFFPKSAWAMASGGNDLRKAYGRWQCTPQRPHGESADPYYRLALRGKADPLAGDFAALCQTIYGPLLAHLEDERLNLS